MIYIETILAQRVGSLRLSFNQEQMMSEFVIFITHANVVVDPNVPVPEWGLSEKGKERHRTFNKCELVEGVTSIYCSYEKKAIDGAEILSDYTKVPYGMIESLHEKDRSSTGYLPEEEFRKVAKESFDKPHESIRGRERAIDAQKRVVNSVKKILVSDKTPGHIAIVAHGGIAAFLLAYLKNKKISRDCEQPANGGGNYFCFDRSTLKLVHGWRAIDQKL